MEVVVMIIMVKTMEKVIKMGVVMRVTTFVRW